MLFDKKNESLSDQQAVYQKRNVPRYDVQAGISIEGFEGEGALKNISVSGCCMESSTYVSIMPDEVYQAIIKPEHGENTSSFSIKLKAAWTKSSEMLFHAGFSVDTNQNTAQMEQYAERLAAHGVRPDYGKI